MAIIKIALLRGLWEVIVKLGRVLVPNCICTGDSPSRVLWLVPANVTLVYPRDNIVIKVVLGPLSCQLMLSVRFGYRDPSLLDILRWVPWELIP